MHHRWKQYSNAEKAAYCKPRSRKKAGILDDATTAQSVEIYAIPIIRCRGLSSYSACAEKGMTSSVPSGLTKSFVGSGLVSLRRSGFFVGGGSSVATRLVVVGWRCVGVLGWRGAWRAAAVHARTRTRRAIVAAMACCNDRCVCPALWLMSLLSSRAELASAF